MTKNYWIISDTHFGHNNILTFKDNDGNPLRPFKTIEEHDLVMVENWNKVVKPDDRIYHLGDVAVKSKNLIILEKLNGHKKLIRGNHDKFKPKEFLKYFEDISSIERASQFSDDGFSMVMSHIPLHPDCINSRFGYNIHGHIHCNVINDKRYLNVCVEKTNYAPINLETVRDHFKKIMNEDM